MSSLPKSYKPALNIDDDDNEELQPQNFQLMLGDKPLNEIVYLMQYGQSSSYKIGKTVRSGEDRLKELNGTKAPHEIILHEEIFTDNASFLEKVLHQRYADLRTRGEWFELKPEQIFEFVTLAKISKFCPMTKEKISALEKDSLIFSESQQFEHDLTWHKYNGQKKSNQSGGKLSGAKEAIRRLQRQQWNSSSSVSMGLEYCHYQLETYSLQGFLEECCDLGQGEVVKDYFIENYKNWCAANGYPMIQSRNRITRDLAKVEVKLTRQRRPNPTYVYSGVRLKEEDFYIPALAEI